MPVYTGDTFDASGGTGIQLLPDNPADSCGSRYMPYSVFDPDRDGQIAADAVDVAGIEAELPFDTEVTATVDSAGEISIAVADADTKILKSVMFAVEAGTTGTFERINEANTTHIKAKCQDGGVISSGKDVVVTYV
jgi:hypothetical protein